MLPYDDIWDPVKRVIDAWGSSAVSGELVWTRASAVCNYAAGRRPFFEDDAITESEKAVLMGGACAEACGWSPRGRRARPRCERRVLTVTRHAETTSPASVSTASARSGQPHAAEPDAALASV